MKHANSLLACSVLAFTLWKARSQASAWFNSPYDHLGWVAFAAWLLAPLVARAVRPADDLRWLTAALLLSIFGTVADLSALHNCALAVALASFVQPGGERLFWLAGFLGWTSALGWSLNGCSSSAVIGVRLSITAVSCSPWFCFKRVVA